MTPISRSFSCQGRPPTSSFDGAVPFMPPLNSSSFSPFRRSHPAVEDAQHTQITWTRPRLNPQLPRVHSSPYAGDLHSMLLVERIRARQDRDDLAALVDFLRNQPPPPGNFMSIPYEDEEDDRHGRWSKMKSMARKSKSMSREPQPIRLPDSAVAGVTIDGHRHIAISIPLEAAPFGENARSQYHVPAQDVQAGTPGSKEPVRTYRNEKGLVTVLRPVSEAHETGDGSTARKRRSPPYPNSQGLHPPPLPPHKPTSILGSLPTRDYIGVLPTSLGTPGLEDRSAPWQTRQTPSEAEGQVQSIQKQQTFQRSTYPARASSMVDSRARRERNARPSIDGVLLQQQESRPKQPLVSHNRRFPGSRIAGQCALTTDDNGAQESDKKGNQRPNTSKESNTQDACPTLKKHGGQSGSPTLTTENDRNAPSARTPSSTRSREAVVRDKIRRDVEAMRHAKLKDQHDGGMAAQQPSTAQASLPNIEAAGSAGTTSRCTLKLSNLMVVMDMKPTSDSKQELESEPLRGPETEASQERAQGPKEPSIPLAMAKDLRILTPPTSPQGSLPPKSGPLDRTSSRRRRKWRAIREKERRAGAATVMAKAKAKHSASGDVTKDKNGATLPADQELLRLCEVYWEHRLRDMERRLRRLERNGDVWLHALAPVLNSMNRRFATAGNEPLAEDTSRDVQKRSPTKDGVNHKQVYGRDSRDKAPAMMGGAMA